MSDSSCQRYFTGLAKSRRRGFKSRNHYNITRVHKWVFQSKARQILRLAPGFKPWSSNLHQLACVMLFKTPQSRIPDSHGCLRFCVFKFYPIYLLLSERFSSGSMMFYKTFFVKTDLALFIGTVVCRLFQPRILCSGFSPGTPISTDTIFNKIIQ